MRAWANVRAVSLAKEMHDESSPGTTGATARRLMRSSGLEGWEIVLIVVIIFSVAIACALSFAIWIFLRFKRQQDEEERLYYESRAAAEAVAAHCCSTGQAVANMSQVSKKCMDSAGQGFVVHPAFARRQASAAMPAAGPSASSTAALSSTLLLGGTVASYAVSTHSHDGPRADAMPTRPIASGAARDLPATTSGAAGGTPATSAPLDIFSGGIGGGSGILTSAAEETGDGSAGGIDPRLFATAVSIQPASMQPILTAQGGDIASLTGTQSMTGGRSIMTAHAGNASLPSSQAAVAALPPRLSDGEPLQPDATAVAAAAAAVSRSLAQPSRAMLVRQTATNALPSEVPVDAAAAAAAAAAAQSFAPYSWAMLVPQTASNYLPSEFSDVPVHAATAGAAASAAAAQSLAVHSWATLVPPTATGSLPSEVSDVPSDNRFEMQPLTGSAARSDLTSLGMARRQPGGEDQVAGHTARPASLDGDGRHGMAAAATAAQAALKAPAAAAAAAVAALWVSENVVSLPLAVQQPSQQQQQQKQQQLQQQRFQREQELQQQPSQQQQQQSFFRVGQGQQQQQQQPVVAVAGRGNATTQVISATSGGRGESADPMVTSSISGGNDFGSGSGRMVTTNISGGGGRMVTTNISGGGGRRTNNETIVGGDASDDDGLDFIGMPPPPAWKL